MNDQQVLELLERATTPGALDEHLWRHPADWVAMQKAVIDDAEDGTGDSATFDSVSAAMPGLVMKSTQAKRRAWGPWSLDKIAPESRLHVVASLHPATYLDQAAFNFLTAADKSEATHRIISVYTDLIFTTGNTLSTKRWLHE